MRIEDHAARRHGLLAHIIAELESDPRVVAAWLSGSHGRGVDGTWSKFAEEAMQSLRIAYASRTIR